MVIDGRVGYTGGFGIADKWQGNGLQPDQWRETNARFEGPVVMQLQAAFMSAWAETTGELLTGDLFFPRTSFDSVGPATAGLLVLSGITDPAPVSACSTRCPSTGRARSGRSPINPYSSRRRAALSCGM